MRLFLLTFLICNWCLSLPLQVAADIEAQIDADKSLDMPVIKKLSDRAINSALQLAAVELKKKGKIIEADDMMMEWKSIYGSSLKYMGRKIGDHKPLSQWLKEKYDLIEFVLGVEVCKKLHLSDIKSLNHGFPVVVKPCTFPMDQVTGTRKDEYKRHFCGGPHGDDTYYGVIPVVTYWAAYTGCTIGTMGTGFVLVCGLAGNTAEKLIGMVADDLSDRLFDRVCKPPYT